MPYFISRFSIKCRVYLTLLLRHFLGKRKRRPRCVRAIDGQQVSNSRCDQRTRPSSVTEECNISCRLRCGNAIYKAMSLR